MTVLIVDDSKIMRTKLKSLLAGSGVPVSTVREAADGVEALRVFDAEPVDVVFTDINMPGMDGRALLKQLAARQFGRRLYRVVCTTETPQALKDELRDFGVDLYIEKPFDGDAVKALLAQSAMA